MMDKTLRELKAIREETERRFRALVEELEGEQKRFLEQTASLRGSEKGGEVSYAEALAALASVVESCLRSQLRFVEALRESMSLHNARCAELARQLTVLPLERMDLILDRFERRLENLECELHRQKKASDRK
jgi:hypothetical protein